MSFIQFNNSLIEDLPDYMVLEILRSVDDISLLQLCSSNKRLRRLCGYPTNQEGIYDRSLKQRLDKYVENSESGDKILIKDFDGYYPIVSDNIYHIQSMITDIPNFNPHMFFIKKNKQGKWLIGETFLHTGAGLFYTAYAPDLGTFYESTFTGVNGNGDPTNIINHFLNNGYSAIIGFVKDNEIHYHISSDIYPNFKAVIESYTRN